MVEMVSTSQSCLAQEVMEQDAEDAQHCPRQHNIFRIEEFAIGPIHAQQAVVLDSDCVCDRLDDRLCHESQ